MVFMRGYRCNYVLEQLNAIHSFTASLFKSHINSERMRSYQIMIFWLVTPCNLVSAYEITCFRKLKDQNYKNNCHENLKTYIREIVNNAYFL
jgi:hypothetical protein